ncbi:MAG: Zn-ribbon domain-containing OB-fold protein [Chloroflexota bacterium]
MAERVLRNSEYVKAIGRGELLGLKCNDCGAIMATPKQLCSQCHSENLAITKLSGRGKIGPFTIIHVPPPKYERLAPYAVAAIYLEEGSGVTARLVDADLSKLAIGKPVEMDYVDWGTGDFELVFRPANG